MDKDTKISVIIPVERETEYLKEALFHYSKQDYRNFEVLVAASDGFSSSYSFVRVITNKKFSGNVSSKRNQILRYGRGGIFVFNDDDVSVPQGYLKNIVNKFRDLKVLAACGPLLTPKDDSFWQRASGAVWESYLGSLGAGIYRSRKMSKRIIYDYPAANLIVRRHIFEAVGGFESGLYPGEDTKLCLLIYNKYTQGIIYDPDLFAYHHRKALFKEHLRQIGRYGTQRGWFALSYPTTSFKIQYFLPGILLIYFLSIPFFFIGEYLFYNNFPGYLATIPLVCYIILVAVESVVITYEKGMKLGFTAFLGIAATHLYYGYNFIKSFFAKATRKTDQILKLFLTKKL